jgi:thymidine kinase
LIYYIILGNEIRNRPERYEMAKLYYRYGAMNAGKTTVLLQAAHNYEEMGMHPFLMKPSVDSKGDDLLVSRLGISRKVDLLCVPSDDLFLRIKSENEKKKIDCVFCDEAQFLTAEQVDQLMGVVVELGIPVVCYGLRTDFMRRGFEGSDRLLQTAHTIEEIKTICRCGKKAIFNGRKVNGKFVFEGSQVAIDGKDSVTYESLCASCYLREMRKAGLAR